MAAAINPAQPSPVKLGVVDPVERWGRHTLEGNQAFELGEEIRARQSYSEALAVAEEMMVSAARAHDARAASLAPALYGISCNDIIALAKKQDDSVTAGIFLCKLAGGYLAVMESSEAPISLRARCLQHSRVASAALSAYFEERGMWDATETYSARANAAFFSVQRLERGLVPQPSNAAQPLPSPEPSLGPAAFSSAAQWAASPAPELPRPEAAPLGPVVFDVNAALRALDAALLDPNAGLIEASPPALDAEPPALEASPPALDANTATASLGEPVVVETRSEPPESSSLPPTNWDEPVPAPAASPVRGDSQPELPAHIWSDARPALDLSPPEPPPRRTLGARLLDRVARPFRRSPLPSLRSDMRAK